MQGSVSVMLLQREHSRSLAFTSRTAAASPSASSSLERKMWNASRCALLLPTPGSFFNSSISRAMGSANFGNYGSCNFGIGRLLGSQIQSAQHAADAGLHGLVHFARRLINCCYHQVLQHFHVSRLHRLRID